MIYRPGQPAPESGIYEIVDIKERSIGAERAVAKGDPLPPPVGAGYGYRLKTRVTTVYTSVSSASVLTSTATEYAGVLERLAKK
jgi:hypothetical protein